MRLPSPVARCVLELKLRPPLINLVREALCQLAQELAVAGGPTTHEPAEVVQPSASHRLIDVCALQRRRNDRASPVGGVHGTADETFGVQRPQLPADRRLVDVQQRGSCEIR